MSAHAKATQIGAVARQPSVVGTLGEAAAARAERGGPTTGGGVGETAGELHVAVDVDALVGSDRAPDHLVQVRPEQQRGPERVEERVAETVRQPGLAPHRRHDPIPIAAQT